MFFEERKSIHDISSEKLIAVADFLCHSSPCVRPVYECVKIFARLSESGQFTYARHPSDLGTKIVTANEISSRMNDPARRLAIGEALYVVEEACKDIWPFAPGSSSWIQLEVLDPSIKLAGPENEQAVIFRRAVRLSRRGITRSTLLERMFSAFSRDAKSLQEVKDGRFLIDPQVVLRNTSGSGIFRKFESTMSADFLIEGIEDPVALEHFVIDILQSNFHIDHSNNPGFMFVFENVEYRVQSSEFCKKRTELSSEARKTKNYRQPLPPMIISR